MTLGDRLKQLRDAKGLTQLDAARLAGISDMQISYLERDKRTLTMPVARALAAVYGCTLDELVAGTDTGA